MNLIEARKNIDLKVIKIWGGWRAHRDLKHSGFGRHGRAHINQKHKGIGGTWRIQKKLENLGVREGVVIKKVSQQAFRGPIIVEIGSMRIAIGFNMARAITVEETEQ